MTTLLPDFPNSKKEIRKVVTERLRHRFYAETVFLSRMRKFKTAEGDSFTIHRADGTVAKNRYGETTADFAIDRNAVATLDPKALIEKIDRAALEMAEKATKRLLQKLGQTLTDAGQVHDAKGKPFSPDTYLEALESIDIDFDENGNPSGLMMLVGPALWERIREKAAEWEADPGFSQRHTDLMQRKREAWRDRESNRKLVD